MIKESCDWTRVFWSIAYEPEVSNVELPRETVTHKIFHL